MERVHIIGLRRYQNNDIGKLEISIGHMVSNVWILANYWIESLDISPNISIYWQIFAADIRPQNNYSPTGHLGPYRKSYFKIYKDFNVINTAQNAVPGVKDALY
jgi:hypothetical protein